MSKKVVHAEPLSLEGSVVIKRDDGVNSRDRSKNFNGHEAVVTYPEGKPEENIENCR
jgi:hypothetical protein